MNQTEPNSLRPGDATHLAHAPLKTTSLPAEWGAARNCIALIQIVWWAKAYRFANSSLGSPIVASWATIHHIFPCDESLSHRLVDVPYGAEHHSTVLD